MAAAADTSNRQQLEGTVLVVAAACTFALVALVVKRDPLPTLIATECRFLVSWLVAIFFMLAYRVQRGLLWFGPPELRKWLLLKCALSYTFITLWWTALRYAPVGNCIAIIYTCPIFTSLLSRATLNEHLPAAFPWQAALTSIGTLLIVDPPWVRSILLPKVGSAPKTGPQADYTYVFLALCACAVVPVVTRKTRDCSWIEVEHVSACLACLVLNPLLMIGQYFICQEGPTMPAQMTGEIGLIMLAAGGSFVGIAMETKGYQMAEVGKAAMFRYVEVPFAYLLQAISTGQPVETRALLGSVFIISSCFLGLKSVKARQAHQEQTHDPKLSPLLAA